jgi:V-type H+-transporting ATPase subunit a
VTARLSELETTIDAGDRHRDNVLTSTAYQIETWTSLVRRKKAIFHTLNMLSIDVTRKCLVAEGWCPVYAKPKVRPPPFWTSVVTKGHP